MESLKKQTREISGGVLGTHSGATAEDTLRGIPGGSLRETCQEITRAISAGIPRETLE